MKGLGFADMCKPAIVKEKLRKADGF